MGDVSDVSDERRRRGKGAVAAWAVLSPLLFLALYVLAPIPLTLTGGFMGAPPDGWLYRIYAPFRWAQDNTPLREPIQQYGEFLLRLEVGRAAGGGRE